MSDSERPNARGMWRLINGFGRFEGELLEKKMLKKAIRSRNAYENNRNSDRMPDGKSDIFGDMTCFLRKKAACGAPLGAIGHKSEYERTKNLVASKGQGLGQLGRFANRPYEH